MKLAQVNLKKDLMIVAAVAALALAAVVVSRRGAVEPPKNRDPYRPEAGAPVLARYHAAGGLSPFAEVTIEVRGPDDCVVRYRAHGGPATEKRHPLAPEAFDDLLARLAGVDFFEVDEVPRSGYVADLPSVELALTIGERSHDVTVDARRRSSRDLGPVYRWFEAVRREATPEPVSSGD